MLLKRIYGNKINGGIIDQVKYIKGNQKTIEIRYIVNTIVYRFVIEINSNGEFDIKDMKIGNASNYS